MSLHLPEFWFTFFWSSVWTISLGNSAALEQDTNAETHSSSVVEQFWRAELMKNAADLEKLLKIREEFKKKPGANATYFIYIYHIKSIHVVCVIPMWSIKGHH